MNKLEKTIFETKEIPIMVQFTAPWCPSCKLLKPIIENIKNLYQEKIKVIIVDLDEDEENLSKYFGIRALPTIILLKNSEEKQRLNGKITEKLLITEIDNLLL